MVNKNTHPLRVMDNFMHVFHQVPSQFLHGVLPWLPAHVVSRLQSFRLWFLVVVYPRRELAFANTGMCIQQRTMQQKLLGLRLGFRLGLDLFYSDYISCQVYGQGRGKVKRREMIGQAGNPPYNLNCLVNCRLNCLVNVNQFVLYGQIQYKGYVKEQSQIPDVRVKS